jgi:hypothetical protein
VEGEKRASLGPFSVTISTARFLPVGSELIVQPPSGELLELEVNWEGLVSKPLSGKGEIKGSPPILAVTFEEEGGAKFSLAATLDGSAGGEVLYGCLFKLDPGGRGKSAVGVFVAEDSSKGAGRRR